MTFGLQCDEPASVAILERAAAGGITFLDTADVYPVGGTFETVGRTEEILGRWLRGRRGDFVVATKCAGAMSAKPWDRGASRKHILDAIEGSLRRLGTDYVDLYQPARLDPQVPIEETVGAIAEMVRAGYVRHIGLSEVGAETIRRAHAVHPIAALQIEYSLMSRGIEAEILSAVRELGISVTAYGILSRGLLSSGTARLAPDDPRTRFPRFSGENHARNLELLAALEAIAERHGVSAAQLAIAWVASRGEDIIPLIGTKRRDRLAEALKALDLTLSADDLAAVEAAVPAGAVAGDRYAPAQMATLDAER